MIKKIATVIIFLVAQAILMFAFIPNAHSEIALSPSIESLYIIESKGIRISPAPNHWILTDVIMIDQDIDTVNTEEYLEANVYLPIVPENLAHVYLTDGTHFVEFDFDILSDTLLHLKLPAVCLRGFDGSIGLHMFFIAFMR